MTRAELIAEITEAITPSGYVDAFTLPVLPILQVQAVMEVLDRHNLLVNVLEAPR